MSRLAGISEEEIAKLESSGYSVYCTNDQEGLYAWQHRESYASQSDWKDRQPFRKNPRQAWYDCWCYVRGEIPAVPEPEWDDA